jgi:hypothetical protein
VSGVPSLAALHWVVRETVSMGGACVSDIPSAFIYAAMTRLMVRRLVRV